ncbi:MAG TPA: DUF1015 domain-containing protein [Flavobacteriales bacterium]|nr:DUF1015 domain-containing protein [Flavobacteriales bacterium]
MSIFKPFKATRPQVDKVKNVACRPYDVLNRSEAKADSAGNPDSFYHVIKPEIDFDDAHNPYDESVYKKGRENYERLKDSGVLLEESKECFYVYQLIMDGHKQTGLVGCCAIDDYFENNIKKHELTRPDKEEDRKNHVRYGKINAEPVFFSYPHVKQIDTLVEEVKLAAPTYDVITDDGIQHTLWVVSADDHINSIETYFAADVPSIYVADGHHRTAAGALVGQEFREKAGGSRTDGNRYNYFMAVVFPDNQLKIIDYNRVVKDLNGLSEGELISKLDTSFLIEEMSGQYRPEALHTIGMYLGSKWYKLTAKSDTYDDNDPVGVLDVTILSKQVLEPLFDIVDLRRDKRIDFVGGIRGLGELEKRVNSGEMKVAFAMHPVSMKQLIDISDADLIMPPKVTWFEAKLRSGLFVHEL